MSEESTTFVRSCIGCSQADDHPRHVIATPDPTSPGGHIDVAWHMDCHKIVTNCAVCTDQLAGAENLKGDELRAHLVAITIDEEKQA